MALVSNTVEFELPLDAVWVILTSTTDYAEWNPKLVRIDGAFAAGKTVTLHYTAERPWMPHRFVVHVDICDGRTLQWSGPGGPNSAARRLLHVVHTFALSEGDAPATTRLVHKETFSGALSAVLWPLLRKSVNAGHDKVNAALLARCEEPA